MLKGDVYFNSTLKGENMEILESAIVPMESAIVPMESAIVPMESA